MLAKIASAWLVVLTLTPFTAPFSTCDGATFFVPSRAHRPLPMSEQRSAAAATASLVPTMSVASSRVRLLSLGDLRIAPASSFDSASIAVSRLGDGDPSIHHAPLTNLRV